MALAFAVQQLWWARIAQAPSCQPGFGVPGPGTAWDEAAALEDLADSHACACPPTLHHHQRQPCKTATD